MPEVLYDIPCHVKLSQAVSVVVEQWLMVSISVDMESQPSGLAIVSTTVVPAVYVTPCQTKALQATVSIVSRTVLQMVTMTVSVPSMIVSLVKYVVSLQTRLSAARVSVVEQWLIVRNKVTTLSQPETLVYVCVGGSAGGAPAYQVVFHQVKLLQASAVVSRVAVVHGQVKCVVSVRIDARSVI